MSVHEGAAHCFPLVQRKAEMRDLNRHFPFEKYTDPPNVPVSWSNAGEQIQRHGIDVGVREVFVFYYSCAIHSALLCSQLLLLCCSTTSDEKLIQIKDERDFIPPPSTLPNPRAKAETPKRRSREAWVYFSSCDVLPQQHLKEESVCFFSFFCLLTEDEKGMRNKEGREFKRVKSRSRQLNSAAHEGSRCRVTTGEMWEMRGSTRWPL